MITPSDVKMVSGDYRQIVRRGDWTLTRDALIECTTPVAWIGGVLSDTACDIIAADLNTVRPWERK